MRQISLLPSRTRNGLTISLETYQSPVILYDQSDDRPDPSSSSSSRFGLAIILTCDGGGRKRIGGLRLVRSVMMKRRVPNEKRWTEWEEVQRVEEEVLGDYYVEGRQRYECSLPLPHGLPATRTTQYDQIMHVISATVLDLTPSYAFYVVPASAISSDSTLIDYSRPTRPPASTRVRPRRTNLPLIQESTTSGNVDDTELRIDSRKQPDVLASCRKVFEVVHCPSAQGDVPVLDWSQALRLPDSGKVHVCAHSDLFVLGSQLNLTFDFQDLTPDTTIHAISAKLVQETCTPVRNVAPNDTPPITPSTPIHPPSRSLLSSVTPSQRDERRSRARGQVRSRLSTLWASITEKPPLPKSSILDEYLLLTEGADHIVTPHGFRLRYGSCLWRGEAGRIVDSERIPQPVQAEQTLYLDDSKANHAVDGTLRTISTMQIHRKLRLPSEVHGASASSIAPSPLLARVAHRFEVDVIYSILGQDQLGKPILPTPGSDGEGALRLAKAIVEVGIAACTITPSVIQPPSYLSFTPLPALVPLSRHTSSSSRTSFETHRSNPSTGSGEKVRGVMIPHTRAFRASNGRIVANKTVFYDEGGMEELVGKHIREKGECACTLALASGGLGGEGLGRAVSGSG